MNRRQFLALSAAVPIAGMTATLAAAEFIPVGYYRWYDFGSKTMFWSFYGKDNRWETYQFKECTFGRYRFVVSTQPDVRTACAYARGHGELFDSDGWPPSADGRVVEIADIKLPDIYGTSAA